MNTFNKMIAASVALATIAFAAPWDGTADVSWYENLPDGQNYNIETAEQLAGLAKLVNEGISDFSQKTITLGADIFLNDTAGAGAGTWASVPRTPWKPIGTSSRPFKGEFDGIAGKKNRKIYGLYINDTTQNYVGLFGYTSNVGIRNIDLLVGRVTAKNNVGALVGYASGGSISGVHSEIKVAGNNHVGGLVGYSTGTISTSSVKENVVGQDSVGGLAGAATSSISGTAKSNSYFVGNVTRRRYVGGIVGFGSSITKSYTEGPIKGDSNYVGGVAGYASGSVDSSYHIGGDVSGIGYVGGLIGYVAGSIKNSYSTKNVTGASSYVGGLAGYSAGAVDSAYHIGGDVNGGGYVGGLIGYAYKSVLNSYSEGQVIGLGNYVGGVAGYVYGSIDSTYHIGGDVSGASYVGGVAGYVSGSISSTYAEEGVWGSGMYTGGLAGYAASSVLNSYSTGDVTGLDDYVGGLVGRVGKTIKDSYTKGNVIGKKSYVGGLAGIANDSVVNASATGSIVGVDYVGGLIGKADYNKKIEKSYFEGDSVYGIKYVGGLVGYANYYSYDKSGIINSQAKTKVVGATYVGGLVGYSSKYDITQSNFIGHVLATSNYVGGLAGQGNNIKGSYVEGSVKSDSSYVGGVAGYAVGTVDSAYHIGGDVVGCAYIGGLIGKADNSVKNSYSTRDVLGLKNYVGGLVGYGNSIVNSYAVGTVKSDSNFVGGVAGYAGSLTSIYHIGGSVSGFSFVGGAVGNAAYGSITKSYSIGDVYGEANYIGGLGGHVGSVYNSYAQGNVSGQDTIGGLVGVVKEDIKYSFVKISHVKGRNVVGGLAGLAASTYKDSVVASYFEGDSVVGIGNVGGLVGYAKLAIDSSYSTGHVKGDDNVGGLVGSALGNVSNSYATGNVVGDVDHSSRGNDNIGGLVGYQWSGSISNSVALGNVVGTTKLGGLVGRFDGTKVSQSYANGNVTGSYYGDPADEIGNLYIGGFIGYVKGSGILEETYASGVVKGMDDEPVYTGCIVGYVDGSLSISKSYYDKTKCGLGIDGGEETATVSGSPAKTTAEMQTQETFEDWDFTNTWKIMEGAYPFLQIYSNSLTNAVVETESLDGINYDGSAKNPLVTSVTLFGETLEYETEYTITYKDNVNAGTASINVCGVKPYGGCKVVEFEIAGIAIKPTIAAIDDMTYTGRALTPEIKVYNGETLLAVTDYTAEYKDNVNAGTAVVTVTMKGNYSGSASKTFTIEKAVPVINQNPTASDVVLGQTLAASEFSGGRANVDGEFVWNTPTTKPALENEGYAVVFVPTDTNYTKSAEIIVPVKVLDLVYVAVHVGGNTLDSTTLVKGASYTLPSAPDSTGYDFVGFYKGKTFVGKPNDKIAVSENTVIDAVYKVRTFEITFKNGSTILQSSEVAYGTVPTAPTVTLPKNTAQYTYSFAGWGKDIVAVTEAATYTAVIDSVVNKYEIVFKDYDRTELKDSVYEYGTTAAKIVKPADPKREASARYTYTFKGWSPTISDVIENMVYIATFDSSINTYLIAFVNKYDTLQSVKTKMEYGAIPAYEGTPTRKSTAQYVYTFKEWTPEVVAVSEAATYTAVFDSVVQSYAVTFVNGSEELQSDEIAYGKLPEYAGVKPTKTATAQYTYTFKGWTPAIAKVTGTATYKAVFDSVINRYLVTFKNGSKVIQRDSIAYGTLPTVPSITLPKNTTQYTYSMSWDKTVVKVTGDAVYTATIDSTVNKYEVSFRNYDGTLIKKSTYAYGSTVAKPSDPTRASTAKFTFTFKGWTPIVASVTANAVYKAVFDSTVRTYTVTFMNGDKKLQTSNLAYGSMPKYTGVTPTKASTKNYNYEFIGWSPKIETVVGAATYKAVFDSIKATGMMNSHLASLEMSVNVISRNIQVSAASIGSIYAVFDMQGRVLKKGRVETPNFNILMPQAGMYFVRVGNYEQRISIK